MSVARTGCGRHVYAERVQSMGLHLTPHAKLNKKKEEKHDTVLSRAQALLKGLSRSQQLCKRPAPPHIRWKEQCKQMPRTE
eukprot:scaffold269215_cov22-Tisochrysis_lutea.AAC.5